MFQKRPPLSKIYFPCETRAYITNTVKVSFNGFSPQKSLCHFEPNLQTALSSFPYLYLRKSDSLIQASMFPPRFKHILCLLKFIFLAQQEEEHLTINLSQKFCQHVDRCRRVFRKKEICKCILWSKETIKYTLRRGRKMFTRKRLGT